MSRAITQEEMFQEILVKHTTGDETSEQFRSICIEQGLFEDDPGINRATKSYMERRINALARLDGWVDKDGNPTELVHIVRTKSRGGKKTHHRVQLHLCGFNDMVWLVRDRLQRESYFHSEAKKYCEIGSAKFGRRFQKLFQFD
jgi:hypothetical protein